MYYCKFITKDKQVIHRNFKFKQPYEIEAMAKARGWILFSLIKEV